ncbi:MAG: 4Fe-4S binding protein [Oscillospiraceae bacterium]|nr:4Fe-4S binding protein [Oscillospiraceae bacterium]
MSRDDHKINEEALARRAKIKNPAKKGKAVIEPHFCKGCGLCIDACPTGVLLFREAPDNRWGVEVEIDGPDYCSGCGMCEMICPDFAIFAYKTEDPEKKAV